MEQAAAPGTAKAPVGTVSGALRLIGATAAYGGVLFLAAGTVAWPAAWAYLALMTGVLIVYGLVIVKIQPDLIQERNRPPADAKHWDKPLVTLIAVIGPFAMLLAAGFDRRYHWSPAMSRWLKAAGLLLAAAGGALTNYAVAVNRFFSALVRIQRDRGHHVVDAGPYHVVRHPSYAASIAATIGAALALGSLAGLGVSAFVSLLIVVRTVLEDHTLQNELEGYREYAGRVRWRLLPFVW